MVSAGTDSRIAFCGSGTPGVLEVPVALFSRPHAEASSTTAADVTSVFLARDIWDPFGRSLPRGSREAGAVDHDVCRAGAVPPGGRLAAGPGVGTGRRCGLKSRGAKAR